MWQHKKAAEEKAHWLNSLGIDIGIAQISSIYERNKAIYFDADDYYAASEAVLFKHWQDVVAALSVAEYVLERAVKGTRVIINLDDCTISIGRQVR
ncbi:MAG: hypothetical protein QXE80_09140 [Pyrobaculum sp.]